MDFIKELEELKTSEKESQNRIKDYRDQIRFNTEAINFPGQPESKKFWLEQSNKDYQKKIDAELKFCTYIMKKVSNLI